jgi:glycosyltransferase involved in cell wall biosynthesis
MRVLILADLSTIHSIRWYDALAEHFEVRVVSLEKPMEEREDFIFLPTRVKSQRWKYILNLRRVKAVIEEFQPDLLNPHFIPNYGLLSTLSSDGRPCVLCIWGSDLLQVPKKSWIHRRITRWILGRMDEIIVDGQMMVPILKGFGVSASRMFVMPFGLDEELRNAPLADLSDGIFRIVTHRRLVPEMDPLTLVEALGLLAERRSDFEVIICSSGPLEGTSKQRVRQLGLSERVRFLGHVPEATLYEHLRAAHIYVSASVTDSTSMSLLESMACGAFPVVSDIEGNREWILDGENGRLFDTGDPESLATVLDVTMNDRDLLHRGREKNKRLIHEKANWGENVNRVAKTMEKLASETHS